MKGKLEQAKKAPRGRISPLQSVEKKDDVITLVRGKVKRISKAVIV